MSATSTNAAYFAGLMQAWQRTYSGRQQLSAWIQDIAPISTNNRSSGDAIAAWLRYHNPDAGSRFSAKAWLWYAVLERARVETLAAQHLPGIEQNLNELALTQPQNSHFARVYRLARQVLSGQEHSHGKPVQEAAETVLQHDQSPSLLPGWLPRFTVFQQRKRIQPRLSDSDIIGLLQPAITPIHHSEQFAEAVHALVERLSLESGQAATDLTAQYDFNDTHDSVEEHPDATQTLPGQQDKLTLEAECNGVYKVFSRQWDECLPAQQLANAADMQLLHSLDQQNQRPQLRRLAHQLQRRLLAARLRSWSFDQEEGVLDNRKLARLSVPGGSRNIFRQESAAPVPEACVTFLIDQSGSMRGERQRLATIAIDLAVHTLESCRINTEVLGFTTHFFTDNPAYRAWVGCGRPPNPGRLNALRHIVYKSANQPWRRARRHLGLLLREGFGCENIDGEALNWAASRLLARPEPRKILVVLSDGVPYDEATASANGRTFLENHLHTVIQTMGKMPIHLAAIGTGVDVGRFYTNALTLREYDQIADVLFEHLSDLLT